MAVVDQLLKASQEIWEKYYTHPLIRGIQTGDLPKEKFCYYILQDYLYLEEYEKVFAIGLAKATHPEVKHHYIHTITEVEMAIHRRYMQKLGITQEAIQHTPRALGNLSYTSFI